MVLDNLRLQGSLTNGCFFLKLSHKLAFREKHTTNHCTSRLAFAAGKQP